MWMQCSLSDGQPVFVETFRFCRYLHQTGPSRRTAARFAHSRAIFAEKKVNAVSPNMVDVKIVLDGTVGGFTVREVGLLDDAGNLIVVSNFPVSQIGDHCFILAAVGRNDHISA